MSSINH